MKRTAVFLVKAMLAIVFGLCCGTGAKAIYRGLYPKQGVAVKHTEDQWYEFTYRHWYRAQFNVFYHEAAGNQELCNRWQVLRDKWRPLFDGERELTEDLKRELYMEQWHIEQDESEPDFVLMHEAQDKTTVVVEQIREARLAEAK